MTEQHECEWHFYEESSDGAFCVNGCRGRLSRDDAELRLNEYETLKKATDALSKGCFNCGKTVQETYLKQFPSGHYTCANCDIAFADIMEKP